MTDSEEHAEQLHKCRFYVQRCIRYHMHRAAFFAKLNRSVAFIGVVFGSAALASLLPKAPNWVLPISALLVTMVSALDLVVGTAQRMWQHNDLRKRFIDVEVELLGADPDAAGLRRLQQKIRSIEADEPPGLAFLNEMASNEVIRAMYSAKDASAYVCSLPWYKRVTANVIDWDVAEHIEEHNTKHEGAVQTPA